MKTFVKILLAILIVSTMVEAQRINRTIKQIQQVPLDSLLLADTVQLSNTARWTLQTSPYRFNATGTPPVTDTITITAVCLVPPRVITYTAAGWTMILSDTSSQGTWSNILVRASSADTTNLHSMGFMNVERGDVIKMTGIVEEFPLSNMNSITQFRPLPGFPIEPIDQNRPDLLPAPIPRVVSDFHVGTGTGGTIRYSTGEPYEMAYVEFTNLTVNYYVNPANGTFNMVDAQGNEISTYDASGYYTLRVHRLANATYTLPALFTKIDTIRGYVWTSSGAENSRGYRICPMYPGDVVFGAVLPGISSVRRYPVLVTPSDTAKITANIFRQTGGARVDSAKIFYSVNNAAFTSVKMSEIQADSMIGIIPPLAADAFVRYYVTAYDSAGYTYTVANGSPDFSTNSAKGLFFYYVLNRPTTIRDVQYTPFTNGRGALTGAVVTVAGVVTADTTQLGLTPYGPFPGYGINVWYIQNGNQPWNGIWVNGTEAIMGHVKLGDSISVTGTVSELGEVTNLFGISSAQVHTTGNPVPTPPVVPVRDIGFGVGNGTPSAEKWEGMVVQLNDVVVTSIDPTFVDWSEYEVNDGTGSVTIRRDGKNRYSNLLADTIGGYQILKIGDRISYLRGILHYSARQYKLVPRSNADFGTVTSVQNNQNDIIPAQYYLANNYPNPFNPKTIIEYSVPKEGLVTLRVYNIIGQEVATLKNEIQKPGSFRVNFDGSKLASGIYFYRLQAGNFNQVKKMMLVK
ncbi:MAG: T9SS type A sorting domain-containing protein [Bacteroidota bacterium]|nr:T9SS type A sorting domain-containing protein [Bacteroidota bacterium]